MSAEIAGQVPVGGAESPGPADSLSATPTTYVLPTVFLMLGAMLLIVSVFLPVWQLTLHAPQYPKGLSVQIYATHVAGDVREIDDLNQYIGMAKLGQAAQFERSISLVAITALAGLLIGSVFIRNWWAALLALPAVVYPVVFLADLYYWLYTFGNNLDRRAPLSSSIKPFTPTLLGEGTVGQFRTTSTLEEGFLAAAAAVVVLVVGLYLHRRAYKPLADARRARERKPA